MSTHANMVKMTVTSVASAGVGTITLNAASSGYRTFGTAFGADATVDILITEGTAWEVARNCTYTHSGTTVTRGTLESSSTGSAVTFTSAAVVSVVATADSGRRWDSAGLQSVAATVTTADVTGVVGQLHELDISGLTAARSFVLPAVAAVNDRVGVRITAGYTGTSYTYGLVLKADTGDTLQGVSAAEWSRLIITGEIVIMRCTVANTTWMVDHDGRIAQACCISLTTSADGETPSGVWYEPHSYSGVWAEMFDTAAIGSISNGRIYVRRGGSFSHSHGGRPKDAVGTTTQVYYGTSSWLNGDATVVSVLNTWCDFRTAGDKPEGARVTGVQLASGDYLKFKYQCATAAVGAEGAASPRTVTYMQIVELL